MQAKLDFPSDLGTSLRLCVTLLRSGVRWMVSLIVMAAVFRTFASAPQDDSGLRIGFWLASSGLLIVYFALSCQLYRGAGLGSGQPEGRWPPALRLALAHGLAGLAFVLIGFFVFLFLIIFAVILVAVSGHDPSQAEASNVDASLDALRASGAIWLLWSICLAAMGGLLWFLARLITFGPATVDQQRLIIFRSWSWTKGQPVQLAALIFVLQLVPLSGGLWAVARLSNAPALAGTDLMTSLFSGAAMAAVLLPAVFLGHALAITVYRRCAPPVVSD